MSTTRRDLAFPIGLAVCLAAGLTATPGEPAKDAKEITNSIGMKLLRIPAGKFIMGSPDAERPGLAAARVEAAFRKAPFKNDEEQREVEIAKSFYLGTYTVTQAEYQQVMGKNPSYFCAQGGGKDRVAGMDTSRFPVEQVSWDDAVAFCKKLSELPKEKMAGRAYRLPTEAEWEYACRAGTTTPFHYGKSLSSKQANFNSFIPYGGADKGPTLGRPTTVGSYQPNAFGLYDMHGNVWQWCRKNKNWPDNSTQAVRGGSWFSSGEGCRSASRLDYEPDSRFSFLGFRVAADQSGR